MKSKTPDKNELLLAIDGVRLHLQVLISGLDEKKINTIPFKAAGQRVSYSDMLQNQLME